jgi:prevent-host-death family protein
MTNSGWKIAEAKARFSELVQASGKSPQLLYSRNKPVAAVIGIDEFRAYQRFQSQTERPTMAALLSELDGINQTEPDFGNPPPRVNRPQPDFD